MCHRFSLLSSPEALARRFRVAPPRLEPRYNIAPTQSVLAVRAPGGRRAAAFLRWGLVPAWSRGGVASGPPAVNARSESAWHKPTFREPMRARRCVVPADGFYEWDGAGGPHYFAASDGRPLALAGIWEDWRPPGGGEPTESVALLTCPPNAVVGAVHDRMPVVLGDEAMEAWLGASGDAAVLAPLLAPCPDDWLFSRAVGPVVNDPRREGPACLAPPAPRPTQGELF